MKFVDLIPYAKENKIKMTPLIIEGTPRSGTRFFCKFIEHQFGIKIFRLQRVIRKYYRNIEKYGNLEIDNNIHKLLEYLKNEIIIQERIGGFEIEQIIKSVEKREFSAIIDELLSIKSLENGFNSWGLKFDNPSGMQICDKMFPESKFIHILRDGRDVHLSARNTLSEGFYTPYNNAKFWKRLVEERQSFGKCLGRHRYFEVKYERIITEPEKCAADIAEFLEFNDFKYKEMSIKSNNYNKWKYMMNQKDILAYEAIAGNLLQNLGYQKHFISANMSFRMVLLYKLLETPLRINVYIKKLIKKKDRKKILRRLKLKIRDVI